MAYRNITKPTLTEEQLQFIRDNVETMTQKQMAQKFCCSQGKVFENAHITGIVFPARNSNKPVKPKKEGKFFNVDADFYSWF